MRRHPSLPSGTPSATGSTSPNSTSQNAQRIEVIRNYYQQLCANLRAVMQHLQIPDLAPQRRQAMLAQKEKLEQSLQEFSERVLRPLAQNQQNQQLQQLQQHTRSSSLPAGSEGIQIIPQSQSQMATSTSSGFSPFPYNTFQMTPQGAVGPAGLTMYSNRPYTTSSVQSPVISIPTNSMARQAVIIAQQQQQIIQQQQWAFQQRLQSNGSAPSPSKRAMAKMTTGIAIGSTKGGKTSSPLKSTKLPSTQVSPTKRGPDAMFLDYSTGYQDEQFRTIQNILGFDVKLNKEQEKQLLNKADLFLNELISTACQIASNKSTFENSKLLNRRDIEIALNLRHPTLIPGTRITPPGLRKNKRLATSTTTSTNDKQENTAVTFINSKTENDNNTGVIVIPNISIVKDSHQNKMSQLKKYLLSINQPLN